MSQEAACFGWRYVTLLTTDQDFRVYRRHSRQVVPCVMPEK